MKLNALKAFTHPLYRNMKSYFTSNLLENNKNKQKNQDFKNTFTILHVVASSSIFFIQLHVVCLTFEILFTMILHFCGCCQNSILLCHRMCKVTKESSGANKIAKNAIDFTSITLQWTSSSSRQSVFPTTSDGSQRLPNGGESLRSVYSVKIGPKQTSEPLLG